MKTISMMLLFLISGCSISPVVKIPLGNKNGTIYGYDDASCRNVKLSCSVDNTRGDPGSYREYKEWKDKNGETMCSCK